MSEWKKYKLRDFAETRKEQIVSKGVEQPYIGLEHIEQQSLRLNGIGSSNDVVSNKFKFYNGDVLYGRLRPYFRKVYKPKFDGVCSTEIFVIKPKKVIDKDYLFYLVATEEFTNMANSGSSGTHMPRADWKQIEKSEWELPEITTQIQIAQILTSLDDKIELNLQMNQTLEAMAQALFKEWFVNFNFPNFDGELENGLPKGWRMGRTDELFILQRGFDLPAITRTEGIYPVVAASGISTYHHEYKVKGPGVTTGRSGVLGKVYYVTEDFWPLNTSLFIKEYKNSTPLFAYHILKGMNLLQLNGGSAVPTLNRNDVHGIECIIPNIDVINQFEIIAKSLYQKIFENYLQIQTLTQTRDTLLPKLMSGKIEIKN